MNNKPPKASKNSKIRCSASKVVFVILAIVFIFLGIFFLYDSPAKYVPTQDGDVYINSDGKPILYYTDIFGNTFYEENGKREYAAVPKYIDTQSVATNE